MATKKLSENKGIMDVSHPGKVAPTVTSKPVIVTNRPILKDPMVVHDSDDDTDEKITVTTGKSSLQPKLAPTTQTGEPAASPEPETTPPAAQEDKADTSGEETKSIERAAKPEKPAADESAALAPSRERPGDTVKDADADTEEEKKAAEHDAAIQKLVDSKQYFLPIVTGEKRRSRRVVAIGVFVSIVLLLAWADVALDAGLIHMSGVKAVTHFFSN